MRAGVLCGVEQVEVRDVPLPVANAHEVIVRVSAVGLCGTDAHIFAGHANYNTDEYGQPIPFDVVPQILGHEISGCVEETGTEVNDLAPGDRVVIDQGLNCVSLRREALCEYCRTGDSHQCEFYAEHGITGLPGGLADVDPAVVSAYLGLAVSPTGPPRAGWGGSSSASTTPPAVKSQREG